MSEQSPNPNPTVSLSSLGWPGNVVCVICQHCDWRYLAVPGKITDECPHCHNHDLQVFESDDFSMMTDFIKPPEMYLPFQFNQNALSEKLTQFAKSIPFAPSDLQLSNLQSRVRMVYLPMWLVDSQASATWQAECGYYYQAKSHQEKFSGGRWHTQEVIETRTRWEPRLGKLQRVYQNIAAPAVEEHRQLMNALGNFAFDQAKNATTTDLLNTNAPLAPLVRIPSRDKDDTWPDTLPRFQEQATVETKKACAADEIREFRWSPQFSHQNWSLFLLPIWTSYYLDDENKPQSIMLNGQSGQMSATRRASMKRAKRVSMYILLAAVIIFVLTVVLGLLSLMMEELSGLALIGLIASVLVGLAAIYPVGTAWSINRDTK